MIRRTVEEEPVWQSILNLLYYEHKPFGETEGSLVENLAYANWQIRARPRSYRQIRHRH
jgi:hypothetical protein